MLCVSRSLDDPGHLLDGTGAFGSSGAGGSAPPQWGSDAEVEPDPPDWTAGVSEEVLKNLTAKEKKRQEVLNGELFTLLISSVGCAA